MSAGAAAGALNAAGMWWIYVAAGIAVVVIVNLLVLAAMANRARHYEDE
jgi:hypothetical protein